MKRFALLLASSAFVTPALAADIIYQEPPAPAPIAPVEIVAPVQTWSGLYIGGQAGAAFGNEDDGNLDFDPDGDGPFGDDDGVFDIDEDDNEAGFVGGVHIGYDQQFGNFVLGAVADINYIDAETNRVYSFDSDDAVAGFDGTVAVNEEIDYLGTLRARAGYAFDNVLIYGTGGLSYAGVERDMVGGNGFETFDIEEDGDDADLGYNVGGGVDFLVTDNLSFGVEYLYHNLGENEYSVDVVGTGTDDDFEFDSSGDDLDFHTVWAKASYRFN